MLCWKWQLYDNCFIFTNMIFFSLQGKKTCFLDFIKTQSSKILILFLGQLLKRSVDFVAVTVVSPKFPVGQSHIPCVLPVIKVLWSCCFTPPNTLASWNCLQIIVSRVALLKPDPKGTALANAAKITFCDDTVAEMTSKPGSNSHEILTSMKLSKAVLT